MALVLLMAFLVIASGAVHAAAGDLEAAAAPSPRHYYFTWYDNIGGSNWVLMADPVRSGKDLSFDLNIAGGPRDLSPFALWDTGCPSNPCPAGYVTPGMVITPTFANLMGGPVVAGSRTGDEGIVSQRTLWKGASLEEIPGIDEAELSNHYYWTWYDNLSPGMTNWVLVANPGSAASVDYSIRIAGALVQSGTLPPGQRVTPTFPGVMGGPIEVTASGPVIASQRVLSNYGAAFNEVPGIPEAQLSDRYVWTWYDMTGSARNWVLVANPGDAAVYAEIRIAGMPVWSGQVASRANITPTFPGIIGGPVEVQAWTDSTRTAPAEVLSSQRSLWGPSFEEVTGTAQSSLSSAYHWTWYDQRSQGSTNWVLMANPNSLPIQAEISIGGVIYWSGTIGPGGFATPVFPWVMSGPVEVTSSGGPVIASQRVLWNGYFNETLGVVLRNSSLQDPEWELQRLMNNPHPGNYVDEFLVRAVEGPNLYASSNTAIAPEAAAGYDYKLVNGVRLPDLNPLPGVARFGSVEAPTDGTGGMIYMGGQAWFTDTPVASTRRRSVLTVWNLAADTFQNIEMNAPGKKTDNRNELVSMLDDGSRLIAGEAGGSADQNGDSDFAIGGGLWSIPKATIGDPTSWQRVYQDPYGRDVSWHDLIRRGNTYYALQNAGSFHRLMASTDLTTWSCLWFEDTAETQQARSNLLLDGAGNLVTVHERAGSGYLWVSVFDGSGWAHHQTGIGTVPGSGGEISLDIAAAFDDGGKLIVVRGRGQEWNHTPAFTDVFRVDPVDWSYRTLFRDVLGWPMHQKRLPAQGNDIYYASSYPGSLFRLRHNW